MYMVKLSIAPLYRLRKSNKKVGVCIDALVHFFYLEIITASSSSSAPLVILLLGKIKKALNYGKCPLIPKWIIVTIWTVINNMKWFKLDNVCMAISTCHHGCKHVCKHMCKHVCKHVFKHILIICVKICKQTMCKHAWNYVWEYVCKHVFKPVRKHECKYS